MSLYTIGDLHLHFGSELKAKHHNAVLYLCSDKAGFINGEKLCIDGGMTHQMIYHADNGWTLS